MAKLNSCNRDCVACTGKNVSYPALYRKSLLNHPYCQGKISLVSWLDSRVFIKCYGGLLILLDWELRSLWALLFLQPCEDLFIFNPIVSASRWAPGGLLLFIYSISPVMVLWGTPMETIRKPSLPGPYSAESSCFSCAELCSLSLHLNFHALLGLHCCS